MRGCFIILYTGIDISSDALVRQELSDLQVTSLHDTSCVRALGLNRSFSGTIILYVFMVHTIQCIKHHTSMSSGACEDS